MGTEGTEGTEGENVRVIAGRYRLEDRLGRGGMGVVWRAMDQLLGRQVAVKELLLDAGLSAEESRLRRERTLREARAIAQLRHPHIIIVHDVVEHDERPYMVMELVEGGSLADRISSDGPVDAAEAARMGIALLSALHRAHSAGVLHRDLKPANVLVSEAGRVVLTDFGIAQVSGATTLTETGAFVGSPEYTAPERMSGARTGPESDLWSLGALLCAALSGESPFRRDSLGGILHAVVSDEIRPPAQAAPLLPVILGLLERDPDRRLDAAEAERMLRAYLDTGHTPTVPPVHMPTEGEVPRRQQVIAPLDAPSAAPSTVPSGVQPVKPPSRRVLIAAALVAAMATAGVSAAALLMNGGDGKAPGRPTSSAPDTDPGKGPRTSPGRTSPPTSPTGRPAPTVTVTRSPPSASPTRSASTAPSAPTGPAAPTGPTATGRPTS
ncbi:serine/threonine protein kinase [Streptomyces sporangiiformans]|uniref:non-specific serine/threonine protein kinase n=1 Tax=Streptomyces sporangiiformans TaxID=2315329 RepID=A0A505DHV1_9ACTN|nr:serine/threonine protein kinase [Streptomyces sporangiiformans]